MIFKPTLYGLVFALLAPAALAGGDPGRGRDIAITHCARCHVVGDYNKFGGLGSTPSFQLIAGLDDGMERFQSFYERRPHPVFVRVPDVPKWSAAPAYATEFTVTTDSIDDILAFVRTLEKRILKDVPIVGATGPNAKQRIKDAAQ
jgi:mono/diheme cytochrome c family protein